MALDAPDVTSYVSEDALDVLKEEIELLDGASAEFDQSEVDAGKLSPVFFGSALMNFAWRHF